MADSPPKRQPNFTKPDGVELKEHLETRIAAQQDYFEARLAAMEKATVVATDRLAERLASMNEFRDAMKDLQAQMATRGEMEIQISKINSELGDLKKSRDMMAGKASQKSVDIALLTAVGGLVLGIISLLEKLL